MCPNGTLKRTVVVVGRAGQGRIGQGRAGQGSSEEEETHYTLT